MEIIIKIAKGILNCIYSIFKLRKGKNMILMVSRQGNKESLDFAMLRGQIEADFGSIQEYSYKGTGYTNLYKSISYKSAAHMFEPIDAELSNLEIVILCKKIPSGIFGKIGYCFHMIKQMWYMSVAKVVILDSYCIIASLLNQREETTFVQMWHALGSMKKFGKSIIGQSEGTSEKIAQLMNMHGNYDIILASSKESSKNFGEAFGYGEEYFKVMSLPRVDAILSQVRKEKITEMIYKSYPEVKENILGKKIILYAPTHRKNEDISKDIQALIDTFNTSEYQLVIKLHPLTKGNINYKSAIRDTKYPSLDWLYVCDYFITDYSALMYEAALAKKPMWFYSFDLGKYEEGRNFYVDYEKTVPGKIATTPAELKTFIDEGAYDMTLVSEFARRFVVYQQYCTQDLAKLIESFL